MASPRVLGSFFQWSVALVALGRLGLLAEGVDVTLLDPKTLSDNYGNSADENSNIVFAPIKDNTQYKSKGDAETDVGAIATFYNLAYSIVDTSLPGDFPFKWVKAFKDGTFSIGDDWQELVTDYLGFVIAVVVGLLFMIIFPIVGCCCCCCRCCGKCGGRRVIKDPKEAGHEDKCGRVTAISICSAFLIMTVAGTALMYVTNGNVSSSLDNLHSNQIDKLDDVTTFFDSTIAQAQQMAGGNFNFTVDVLFRDLDNIGYLLGRPLRERVLNDTGLNSTLNGFEILDTDIQGLLTHMTMLQSERANIVNYSEEFHNFTSNITNDVEDLARRNPTFNSSIPTIDFVTNFSASSLPVEDLNVVILQELVDQNISSLADEPRKNLIEIPQRVQNETEQKRQDLHNDVGTYTGDVQKAVNDISSLRDDVLGNINFDDLKSDGKTLLNDASEYDQYRWYGGLGLACVLLFTALLFGCGLVCGLCGSSVKTPPTERGAWSNHGGNMLVAGLCFTFIFCWLTMLLITVLFVGGSLGRKFVCQPLADLSIVDKLMNEYVMFGSNSGNGSWLGDEIFAGKNVNLNLADLMGACKSGTAIYSALQLEKAGVFNLTDLTDYSKRFNISQQLENMNVNFNGLNITTGPLLNVTGQIKNFDSRIDYDAYNSTLSIDPVNKSRVFLTELDNFISSTNFGNLSVSDQLKAQNISEQFHHYLNNTGAPLEKSVNAVQTALSGIQQITRQPMNNNLTVRCETLEQGLSEVQQNLSSQTATAFQDSISVYANRLTTILDTFINDIENNIKTKLGVCTPLWNMYNDIIVYSLCDITIGALCGWWCAMGWAVFFLLATSCASLTLTKHFRKMRMSTGKDSKSPKKKPDGKESPHFFKNRVFHSDIPEGGKPF